MRLTPLRSLSVGEENRLLMYNFPVTFTALVKSAFGQSYMFPPGTDYPKQISISNSYINILFTFIDHFILFLGVDVDHIPKPISFRKQLDLPDDLVQVDAGGWL